MSEGKKHPRFSPALVLPAFVASPFGPPSAPLRPSFGHASARRGQDAVERPSRGRCGSVAISSGLARRSKNKRGATPLCYAALAFQPCLSRLSLVRDGQSFSAFAAAGGQHFSTVGGRHSLAETVLYGGLPAVKLSLQKYTNFLNCEQKMFEKKSFCAILFCKPVFSVAKINSCFAV